MKSKGARAAEYARMSDSYKSNLGRVAYEKSRAKPEDVSARHFASGFFIAFLGFIAKFLGLFGKRRGAPVKRTHARGYSRGRGTGKCKVGSSKLWHRLTAGHSASAGWSDRKTRRYCKTGYWSEPRAEHAKKHADTIEKIGTTSRLHWLKPKVKA